MAVTFYGVNKTLYNTGSVNTIEPELQGGKVRCLIDSYTFINTETATDIIRLGGHLLPAEARIVGWTIDHGAVGGSIYAAFGTLASAACFMASASVVSAGVKTMVSNGVAGTLNYEISAGNGQIPMLTLAGTTPTAGIVIQVAIFYVAKG